MTISIDKAEDLYKLFVKERPIIYVTNDVNNGVGLEKVIGDYHIACIDYTTVVDYLREEGVSVFSLEDEIGDKNIITRNSEQLLRRKETVDFINSKGEVNLLLFKSSSAIEKICAEHRWKLSASPSQLSRRIENKFHFQDIVLKLGINSPPGERISLTEDLYDKLFEKYKGRMVIQFAKSFGGNKTFLIESEEDYLGLVEENRGRRVKVAEYIEGYNLTVNACVTRYGIIVSEPFFQLTGIPELTTYELGACGNDWLYPKLPDDVAHKIFEYTQVIGEYMRGLGYQGIFGLDLVVDRDRGEVFVIENNPRLVTSIPMFTKLQLENGETPLLALHLLEFMGGDYRVDIDGINESLRQQKRGAQFILHNLEGYPSEVQGDLTSGVYTFGEGELKFKERGYSIERCQNDDEILLLTADKGRIVNPGIECARIQTRISLLEDNNRLKDRVLELAKEIYKGLRLEMIDIPDSLT